MNQPAAKPPSPEAAKLRSPVTRRDRTRGPERRIVEVDAAAGVAELGVAGVLEGASDGLVQHVRERAHLGDEGEPAASHLADGAAAHQHPLATRRCQFTRQTSTAALSQRPSRMSVSVMVSEVSTPSASWASTARSAPLRISDAAKPDSGS